MSHSPDRDHDPDRRFAERLAEHYRPEPLDPAQRARFDAALRQRFERRQWAPAWVPALTGVAAALALGWWIWPAATPPMDSGTGVAPVAMASSLEASEWEADVLLTDTDETLAAEEAYLPDEYVALAVAFIDGP
jgi:ferric-dicitrate binding protein FerR (iron transport regulator)